MTPPIGYGQHDDPDKMLGIRLAAVEISMRAAPSTQLSDYDRGLLTAIRRYGGAELVARVDRIERVEASRARKRAAQRKAQR